MMKLDTFLVNVESITEERVSVVESVKTPLPRTPVDTIFLIEESYLALDNPLIMSNIISEAVKMSRGTGIDVGVIVDTMVLALCCTGYALNDKSTKAGASSIASVWYSMSKVLHNVLVDDEDKELSSYKTLKEVVAGRSSMRYREAVEPETVKSEMGRGMDMKIVGRLSRAAPVTVRQAEGIKYDINGVWDII
jgi:hypothetical protein